MKRILILVAAALLAGACGWFDAPVPERARVMVDGQAGQQVRVIISTKFVSAVNEVGQTRVEIFESDTVVATLPFEATYRIRDDQRFFAEAARLDVDLANVRVRVYLDERKEFDQGGPMLLSQPYRFVYSFNQQITREIVVL